MEREAHSFKRSNEEELQTFYLSQCSIKSIIHAQSFQKLPQIVFANNSRILSIMCIKMYCQHFLMDLNSIIAFGQIFASIFEGKVITQQCAIVQYRVAAKDMFPVFAVSRNAVPPGQRSQEMLNKSIKISRQKPENRHFLWTQHQVLEGLNQPPEKRIINQTSSIT